MHDRMLLNALLHLPTCACLQSDARKAIVVDGSEKIPLMALCCSFRRRPDWQGSPLGRVKCIKNRPKPFPKESVSKFQTQILSKIWLRTHYLGFATHLRGAVRWSGDRLVLSFENDLMVKKDLRGSGHNCQLGDGWCIVDCSRSRTVVAWNPAETPGAACEAVFGKWWGHSEDCVAESDANHARLSGEQKEKWEANCIFSPWAWAFLFASEFVTSSQHGNICYEGCEPSSGTAGFVNTCWLLNALRLLWQVEQLDSRWTGRWCMVGTILSAVSCWLVSDYQFNLRWA